MSIYLYFLSIFIVFPFSHQMDVSYLTDFFYKYEDEPNRFFAVGLTDETDESQSGDPTKKLCSEDELMYSLAKMQVVSPERIIEMIFSEDDLNDVCRVVNKHVRSINQKFQRCIPLSEQNLYWMLFQGVTTFRNNLCDSKGKIVTKMNLNNKCIKPLREEFIDCEGVSDWFEKTNSTQVCQIYQDVTDCNYVNAAELCGIEVANLIRKITILVFDEVLAVSCKLKNPPIGKITKRQYNSSTSHLFSHNQVILLPFIVSIILNLIINS